MVFDKQHLSLFVALAFFMVYVNASPPALSNEPNVERLRGDLHQFIEMIVNCLTNSKTNSKIDPAQLRQFKKITNSLQADVGLGGEPTSEMSQETEGDRKFDGDGQLLEDGQLTEDGKTSAEEVPEATEEEEEADRKAYGEEEENPSNEEVEENQSNETETIAELPVSRALPESRAAGKTENKLIPFIPRGELKPPESRSFGKKENRNKFTTPFMGKESVQPPQETQESRAFGKNENKLIPFIPHGGKTQIMNQEDSELETSKPLSIEEKPESRSFGKKENKFTMPFMGKESVQPSQETPETPESRAFGKNENKLIPFIPHGEKTQIMSQEDSEPETSKPLSIEENPESRSFNDKKEPEEEEETETEIIGEISAEVEEKNNRREFDLAEGSSHSFTPRPTSFEGIMAHTIPASEEEASEEERKNNNESEGETTLSLESNDGTEPPPPPSKSLLENLKQTLESTQYKMKPKGLGHGIRKNIGGEPKEPKAPKALKVEGRKSLGDESDESSKTSSESNTEEIEVRNLIKDNNSYASDSSVHPYEALHVYGIQANGPINKIVFEGGEHHPPRPLTIKESNHLKEFIKMVLNTNKLHNPVANFPNEDEIAPRSGMGASDRQAKMSPWADKPVPVELV